MSTNLPVPTLGGGPLMDAGAKLLMAARVADDAKPEAKALGEVIRKAGSAAERADRHVQKWREGMAKMTLEVAMRDDPELDRAFALIQRTGAWKLLVDACLESPKIMAELRSYWKPEDKVEIR